MYFLWSKETVLSLKYVYAINSSIAFSQKAQFEIAPSIRRLLRFKAAHTCLLQFAAIVERSRFARVLLARVIDSTSEGGDREVDANGRKIACDSLKSLQSTRAVLLYAERWFRDSRRDTDRPRCIVSPFAPCWVLLSPFPHCPTYRPSLLLSLFLSPCFSFTLLTLAHHRTRVHSCCAMLSWMSEPRTFPMN